MSRQSQSCAKASTERKMVSRSSDEAARPSIASPTWRSIASIRSRLLLRILPSGSGSSGRNDLVTGGEMLDADGGQIHIAAANRRENRHLDRADARAFLQDDVSAPRLAASRPNEWGVRPITDENPVAVAADVFLWNHARCAFWQFRTGEDAAGCALIESFARTCSRRVFA